jgi:hypothetical protein
MPRFFISVPMKLFKNISHDLNVRKEQLLPEEGGEGNNNEKNSLQIKVDPVPFV